MENNCVIERNALRYIIQFVKEHSVKRVFLVGDINTYPLAGDKIRDMLSEIAVSDKEAFAALVEQAKSAL